MKTFVKVVVLAFGIVAAGLLFGLREAVASPRFEGCLHVTIGPVSIECDEAPENDGSVDLDADGSATGQGTVCGNAVGVLGDASASCEGSSAEAGGDGSDDARFDSDVVGDASGHATACGNAVAVGGSADADCGDRRGGLSARADQDGEIDVLRWGLAVNAITCGNGVAVLGRTETSCRGSDASDAAGTDAGGSLAVGDAGGDEGEGAVADGSGSGRVTTCGNTVAVAGEARANCDPEPRAPDTAGDDAGGAPPEVPPPPAPAPVPAPDTGPGTEVLGLEGTAPEVLGAGSLPQAGEPLAALLWAILMCFLFGVAALLAGRSIRSSRPIERSTPGEAYAGSVKVRK